MSTVVPGGWPPSPANDPGLRKVEAATFLFYLDSNDQKYHGVSNGTGGTPGQDVSSGDAATALQNTINALSSSTGTIFIKNGQYSFSKAVSYTGSGNSSLNIIGETPYMNRFFPVTATAPTGVIIVADGAYDVFDFGSNADTIGPNVHLKNLYITGKKPSLEPLGATITTNGSGIFLQNYMNEFTAENVQIHRKQYGIQANSGSGPLIDNFFLTNVLLTYNQYGLYQPTNSLAYVIMRNVQGYVNQFSFVNISPSYDLFADVLDDEGSGFNNTASSATCPITITVNQDAHLRRVTVVTGTNAVPLPSKAMLSLQFADYANAELEDVLLVGGSSTSANLYCFGSTNGYRVQIKSPYIGKNPNATFGYRGNNGTTGQGISIQNAGYGVVYGGEVYATTPWINGGTGIVTCQNVTNINNQGYGLSTPSVPNTGVDQQNTNPFAVLVYITGTGSGITAYGVTDILGTLTSFTATVNVGQAIPLAPNEKIRLTYTGSPTWKWKGL